MTAVLILATVCAAGAVLHFTVERIVRRVVAERRARRWREQDDAALAHYVRATT